MKQLPTMEAELGYGSKLLVCNIMTGWYNPFQLSVFCGFQNYSIYHPHGHQGHFPASFQLLGPKKPAVVLAHFMSALPPPSPFPFKPSPPFHLL